MASKWPPVKNSGYTFRCFLFAQSDNQIKTSPTIAAGDFQVSTDGGSFGNLGTTPSESPASSGQLLVTLSSSEMNGDEVVVRAIDASGDEWHSQAWVIHTVAQTLDTIDSNVDSILADTGTDGVVLADDAITAAKIATNAITADAIANDAIDQGAIADNAIGADQLGPTAVAEIADAVWEEAIADHSGISGSAAEYLEGAGGGSTPSAIADAVWDEALSGHTTAGTAGKALQDIPGAQAGAIAYTYTVDDGTDPIEGAEVWISTDSGGASVIWYGTTDASGVARASNDEKPWLDAGTYYAWVRKGGYSFSNPDALTVS